MSNSIPNSNAPMFIKKYHLKKNLLTLKCQASESLKHHFDTFDKVISNLQTIGCELEELDKVIHLLLTLPEEYDIVVSSLEAALTENTTTLTFLKSTLLDYEICLEDSKLNVSVKAQLENDFTDDKDSIAESVNSELPDPQCDLHSPSGLDKPSLGNRCSSEEIVYPKQEITDPRVTEQIFNCRVELQDIAKELLCAWCGKWSLTAADLQQHKLTHKQIPSHNLDISSLTRPTSDNSQELILSVCDERLITFLNVNDSICRVPITSKITSASATKPQIMSSVNSTGYNQSNSQKMSQEQGLKNKHHKQSDELTTSDLQNPKYICDICDKQFIRKSCVAIHLKTHYKNNKPKDNPRNKKITCSVCHKQYSLANKSSHMKSHKTENVVRNKTTLHKKFNAKMQTKQFRKQKLICDICGKQYSYKLNLAKHIKLHDSQSKKDSAIDTQLPKTFCDICGIKFNSKHDLTRHVNEIHASETKRMVRIGCNICFKFSCSSRSDMVKHKKESHQIDSVAKKPADKCLKEKTFTCDICNMSLSSKQRLITHKSKHLPLKPYSCKVCDKRYADFSGLFYHNATAHGDKKQFSCNVCHKRFAMKSELTKHDIIVHQNVRVQCDICDKSYKHKSNLIDHYNVVHLKLRRYTCDVCNKSCTTLKCLQSHKKVHQIDKPLRYVCHECGKAFTSRVSYYVHKKTHKEFQFECDHCGQKCAQKGHLLKHMAVHIDKKDYAFKCKVCKKKFASKWYLDRHKATHVKGDKPFSCNICGQGFYHKFTWNRHMKKPHLARPPTARSPKKAKL